ncbi:hypothetical protein ACOSP7_003758 [Xanthoceras sorbifolium]
MLGTLEFGSGEVKVIWGLSKNGDFTVNTAYKLITEDKDIADWKWKHLWKLKIPPKLQMFLWMLLHGKILTNQQKCVKRTF